MVFTLIICTYMRDEPLLKLLLSMKEQTLYPNEILIIDGSLNNKTKQVLEANKFENLKYCLVDEKNRGLTKQRNYGVNLVSNESEIVCFLDDDIVLTPNYFENLMRTYDLHTDALAVGGYIINEVTWGKASKIITPNKFYYDGWERSEPSRFKLRRKFGFATRCRSGVSTYFRTW